MVLTNAALAVGGQPESCLTGAHKGAVIVGADLITVVGSLSTLINI